MKENIFFNAHHSPVGAFASLTCGCKGAQGGLGLELKGPANESIYIGAESREHPGQYLALPFFDGAESDFVDHFDVEGLRDCQFAKAISAFEDGDISREFGACIDTWAAGDISFRVISPVLSVPDPLSASDPELMAAIAPAILAELTLDNRRGTFARKAFFGYAGSDQSSNMRIWEQDGLVGVGQGRSVAIATDYDGAYAGVGFQPEAILEVKHRQNLNFLLGNVGLLVATVPAGEVRTIRFSISFFRGGTVTTGIDTRYLYNRFFSQIEGVASYALTQFSPRLELATTIDHNLRHGLTQVRCKVLAHATRSYLGATQLMETAVGDPLWIVNEGEYRMINTFDLTVDQLYLELALNPWTVRNVLDLFVSRYSYTDEVQFPGSDQKHPGGLIFTHDMGITNSFSPEGFSCYEQGGLKGVFSYMSCEELVNWALCACLYYSETKDIAWAEQNRAVFVAVLQSLVNRDHPDPAKRNGVMGLDSSRCLGGAEITTYDSIDSSLGQARNNIYLAVKSWSVYVLIAPLLQILCEETSAELAMVQATLCARTIENAADGNGLLPALFGEGVTARIIPAIEGLVFPLIAGRQELLSETGPFAGMIRTLARHLGAILQEGICLFEDGGWKLSSTSRNSWLSKIYLCQFVAESVLGLAPDTRADLVHLGWLMDDENTYYAWSDQMLAGKACGSRYYPRGVTAALWLAGTSEQPVQLMRDSMTGQRVLPQIKVL